MMPQLFGTHAVRYRERAAGTDPCGKRTYDPGWIGKMGKSVVYHGTVELPAEVIAFRIAADHGDRGIQALFTGDLRHPGRNVDRSDASDAAA